MSYISARKLRLQTQLTKVQTQLDNLYDSLSDTSASSIHSYTFDSGEGSQRVTRRKFEEIQNLIDRLEAKERHIINELSCMGLVNIALRRKQNNV